jgi:cytochrome c-type biogenesis protein CcmH
VIRRLAAVALAAAALLAAGCGGSGGSWTPAGLEQDLMCVPCNQRLDQSQSAVAVRMRTQLAEFHRKGWSEQRVKDYFVAQYGPEVLAAPPRHGFDLLAWVIPAVVLIGGAAIAFALAMAWSRSRGARAAPDAPAGDVDDAMAARIDRDLQELE